jgi:hypothetical protein
MTNEIEASSSSSLHTSDTTSSAVSNEQSATTGPVCTFNPQGRRFTVFSNLPYELQNMVWTIAACEPRVVEIDTYTTYFRKNEKKKTELRCLSRTLVPAILHVCSRSRKMALKLYERICFRDHFTGSYINWACDYIRVISSTYKILIRNSFKNLTDLSEIYRKCRRLVMDKYSFMIGWSTKFKSLEEVVILFGVTECRGWPKGGNVVLAPVDDHTFSNCPIERQERENRLEQQFRTLMQVDDLKAFSTAISRRRLPGNSGTAIYGEEWFQSWELSNLIEPFQRASGTCKSFKVMHAIRGNQQGMSKERRAERKAREKFEAQKQYRLAHPEIPWHEHGFQDDCPCIECTGAQDTNEQGQSLSDSLLGWG